MIKKFLFVLFSFFLMFSICYANEEVPMEEMTIEYVTEYLDNDLFPNVRFYIDELNINTKMKKEELQQICQDISDFILTYNKKGIIILTIPLVVLTSKNVNGVCVFDSFTSYFIVLAVKNGKVGYIDVFVEFPLENKNGVWL